MARKHIFADESGNFDFRRAPGATRYFILTTVTSDCFGAGDELLKLRRVLAWEGLGLNSEFHATEDTLQVRERVFEVIAGADLRVDATILEKSKTDPMLRASDEEFYRHAWYLHLRDLAPRVVTTEDELLVVGASLGTRKKRNAMYVAVADVVRRVSPTLRARVAYWAASSDPCLQIADYCCWAVRRKWESGDSRAYDRIRDKIHLEVDVFAERPETWY